MRLSNGKEDFFQMIDIFIFLLAVLYYFFNDSGLIFYMGIVITVVKWRLLSDKSLVNCRDKYDELSRAIFPVYHFVGLSIAMQLGSRDHIQARISNSKTLGEAIDSYFDFPALFFFLMILILPFVSDDPFGSKSVEFLKLINLMFYSFFVVSFLYFFLKYY